MRLWIITHLYHTIFFSHWRTPDRSADRLAAPACAGKHGRRHLGGAAPCYLKSHSRGEYVFDRGWAEAYERAGGSYYPKLQVAVPFTPATGRRLLVRAKPQCRGAPPRARRRPDRSFAASPAHPASTSPSPPNRNTACSASSAIPAAHRPAVPLGKCRLCDFRRFPRRAEFAQAQDHPPRAARRAGKRHHRALAHRQRPHRSVWDAFFAFYMETGSRKWGRPYLTRPFYSLVGETMRDRVVLVMAKRAGRWIAGAINFIGSRTLFGRHWGAIEHHPFLHFELCYYQAIDYAIAHKLCPRRSRRPGRAQDRARLYADDDLFGALHRRSGAAPRDRRLSGARARLCRGGRHRACRHRAVPQGSSMSSGND
jgi:hypothetical protein